jgi:hypothetical protein
MAELWRLNHGHHLAVCSMWNHEEGAEVRCEVDGAMQYRLIGCDSDLLELLSTVEAWRLSFEEGGWTVAPRVQPS